MNGAALLIGNAAYEALPGLSTPVSDVRLMGDCVEALGFVTSVIENGTLRSMHKGIAEFRARVERLEAGTSVLIYFAGHGAQHAGDNYLLPVDANPINDEWRRGSVTLSALLEDLCWQPQQQKLIVLDACRTNGIASTMRSGALGLSGVSTERYEQVRETMILYAARPGQVALDGAAKGSSPICRAMLTAFGGEEKPLVNLVPDIAVAVDEETAGQQDPWYTGNLKRMRNVPFWKQSDQLPTIESVRPQIVHDDLIAKPHLFKNKADEEVARKAHLVHKLKAKDTSGRWAYYFILVESEHETAFLRAIEGDRTVDLERFGKVIASCYGEEPTPEVRQFLREHYGWEV